MTQNLSVLGMRGAEANLLVVVYLENVVFSYLLFQTGQDWTSLIVFGKNPSAKSSSDTCLNIQLEGNEKAAKPGRAPSSNNCSITPGVLYENYVNRT